MLWPRRRVLQLGGLSIISGLAGCTSSRVVGTLGFVLRNYTTKAYDARVEIRIAEQIVFKQTYQLPAANDADPYVITESNAVSNVPYKTPYVASLFLDGTEVKALKATMDCTERNQQPMNEEVDIDIGFGSGNTAGMTDSTC